MDEKTIKAILEALAKGQRVELLRQKDFCLGRTVDEGWLLRPDAVERIVAEFRRTQPFVGQLNRAVRYAYEEMM